MAVVPVPYVVSLCLLKTKLPKHKKLGKIQGADKVHTLLKSNHGEEYVGRFRFVVFERYGIDIDAMFRENPVLDKLRDSFVILPPLDEISSTEVRNRFYEDKDFSDLVPNMVVEVMSKYNPDDFSISFEERMKVKMASGRSQENPCFS